MIKDALYMELSQVLEIWRKKGNRWPKRMPHEIRDAVPWWIAHQEPARRNEQARHVPSYQGDGMRMVLPYVERLVYTLHKYLIQDQNFQSLIVSAWEDQIPWRGEDPHIFKRIIPEYELKNRIGIKAYLDQSKEKRQKDLAKIAKQVANKLKASPT